MHINHLIPVETAQAAETQALGEALGRWLLAAWPDGGVLALYGELGSGKTQLTKGVAAAFGIPPDRVDSPTFTLVNEYAGTAGMLYHFDAYRIEREDELYALGFEDYFYSGALCVVEWPERVEALLPRETLRLSLTHLGPTRRRIEQVERPAA